jgi:hypothetical protein
MLRVIGEFSRSLPFSIPSRSRLGRASTRKSLAGFAESNPSAEVRRFRADYVTRFVSAFLPRPTSNVQHARARCCCVCVRELRHASRRHARAKPPRGAAYLSEQVRCAAHGRAAIALALTRTILSERRVIYAPRLRHLIRTSVSIPPLPAPALENGSDAAASCRRLCQLHLRARVISRAPSRALSRALALRLSRTSSLGS